MLLVLAAMLLVMFWATFLPGKTLFSNDGPLGRLATQCHHLPERFTGSWNDLNSIGSSEGAAQPDISFGLQWLLKPLLFSRLYVPIALTILGVGAWCFFRQLGLARPACRIGGVAAAFNSDFFSTACWGVAAQAVAFGMGFLAMAALTDTSSPRRWWRVLLAGLAVGMGVSEGADVGAILSLYVAAYVLWQACIAEGPRVTNLLVGISRLALVIVAAVLLAAYAIFTLVATNITGVVGTQQDAKTRAERWDWATQWSLPKREVLGLAVPGLFGYRYDTKQGGAYWGTIGRAAAWDRYVAGGSQGRPPEGFARYSGSGYYAGVAVLLVAAWAAAQALRRKGTVFTPYQRRWIWFWIAIGVVSLLLGFGRNAPFYRFIYALPYFSTIRNPIKFLHLVSYALVVLFAYGVDGLWRNYMERASSGAASKWAGFINWWGKAPVFEKRWLQACVLVLLLSLAGWAAYAASRETLENYLPTVQVAESAARAIVDFSIRQVGWFELFFVLACGLMALILSGAFAGTRARTGAVLLGLLVAADLVRANQLYVVEWDWGEKYASNPIVELLRDRPYEHRVTLLPFTAPPRLGALKQLCRYEWFQHVFPYYNIQTLDIVDMPRKPQDIATFEKTLFHRPDTDPGPLLTRSWQLTNTRYLLGLADYEQTMNDQIDPIQRRVRLVERFRIVPKMGLYRAANLQQMTAELAPDGPYGLFEFTGALPRARLYFQWETPTNFQASLDRICEPAFDPERSVLAAGAPPPPSPSTTRPGAEQVEFVSYAPKNIVLRSDAPAPAMLLLNDLFDADWKVFIDGRPGTLLRCNCFMRGVYLDAGQHTIQFHFQPPIGPLYITLAVTALGLLGLGFVLAWEWRDGAPASGAEPRPRPAAASAPPQKPARKGGREEADPKDAKGRPAGKKSLQSRG